MTPVATLCVRFNIISEGQNLYFFVAVENLRGYYLKKLFQNNSMCFIIELLDMMFIMV